MALHPDYEMVIGLEVHAQLSTHSKLFSGTSTNFGADPNTQINVVDIGMPGVLPVLNTAAVEAAIKTGLAIKATVNPVSVFARKNYFYPDLPKGYQISQHDKPVVENGTLAVDTPTGVKHIRIQRAHLEEDAGKSVHDLGGTKHSHVDLNRAGIPLLEIVSHPDISTPDEAGDYMKKLRALLRHIGVCDGNMEQGSLRCDANVSVRKKGDNKLGTRCEIKNLNSIRNVMRAIQVEAERQTEIVEAGGSIKQETRSYDAGTNTTRTLRSKEDAHDYRYFPDPDLLPLRISPDRIAKVKATLPELLEDMKTRFMNTYGLGMYDAGVLTETGETAAFYEALVAGKRDPKIACNWMTVELFSVLNKQEKEISDSPISAAQLGELLDLIADNTISGKIAKDVFAAMLAGEGNARDIVAKKGLTQITDTAAIEKMVQDMLAANATAVADYKANPNPRSFGFFVGQAMKASGGKANPQAVNEILKKHLG